MVGIPSSVNLAGTPLSGSAPLTVAFTGSQQPGGFGDTFNVGSWAWTFGDGGTSNVQNPTHVYAAAGTYVVNLSGSFTKAGGGIVVRNGFPVNVIVTAPLVFEVVVGTPWEPPPSFSFGYAGDADVSLGVAPTRPGLWWFHAMGEEIRNVIAAAGFTQDLTDTTQFTKAIRALIGVAAPAPTLLGSAAGLGQAFGTAQLTVVPALIAAGQANAQGSGAILIAQALSGFGQANAQGSGLILIAKALSGSGTVSALGAGTLYLSYPLSGTGVAVARGTGSFYALSGAGNASASGTAVLIP